MPDANHIRSMFDELQATITRFIADLDAPAVAPPPGPWDDLQAAITADPLFVDCTINRNYDGSIVHTALIVPLPDIAADRVHATVTRDGTWWRIDVPGRVGMPAVATVDEVIACLTNAIMDRLPRMIVKPDSRTVIATPTGQVVIEVDPA